MTRFEAFETIPPAARGPAAQGHRAVGVETVASEVDTLSVRINAIDERIQRVPGNSEDFEESTTSLLFSLIIAVVAIYLALAGHFESSIQPVTIMMALPLALFGAIVSRAAFGPTLNICSFIGIIMLMGLVTKSSILLVDYTNTLRQRGCRRHDPMVGGMLARTALITALMLYIVPVFYTLLDDLVVGLRSAVQRLRDTRRRPGGMDTGRSFGGFAMNRTGNYLQRTLGAQALSLRLVLAAALTLAAVPSAAQAPGTERQPVAPEWTVISGAGAEAQSGDAVELTLADALRRALDTNETVLLARSEEARLEGELRQTVARARPQLTADADYGNNIKKPVIFFGSDTGVQRITIGSDYDVDASLTLKQQVLDLRFGAARRAARLSANAARAGIEDARATVAYRTRLAYFGALLARELVVVQTKALEQAQGRLSQVQEFYDAGTAAEFDLLTAQVEVDNIRPEKIQAENQLALSVEELRRITGIPTDTPLRLVDGFPEVGEAPDLDEAVAVALDHRQDILAQSLQAEAAAELKTAADRSSFPTLDFETVYRRQASTTDVFPGDDQFSNSWTASLGFTWPLFESGARAGRIAAAEATQNTEALRLKQLEEDARLEVRQAVLALGSARQSVMASESNVRRAEKALSIAGVRYQNGLSTQVELNDAELAVTRARSNYARALYDLAIARADLDVSQGDPALLAAITNTGG